MAKDTSYYFSHDYNSRQDPKIKKLISKHGIVGYGIFWAIVEDLYNNGNNLPADFETIAYDLRVGIDLVKSVISDFDLFLNEDGFFGSSSVGRRLNERESKSEKARESAHKRWDKCQRIANALQSESDCNAIKESKGKDIKEKKENETKENTKGACDEKKPGLTVAHKQVESAEPMVYPTFNDFWNLYDKKIGREKSEKKWGKLTQSEKEKILEYLPGYIAATPDAQYRKNPETFLNNKSWNDEIISREKQPAGNRTLSTEYLKDLERRISS